jgi:hypothetical protein
MWRWNSKKRESSRQENMIKSTSTFNAGSLPKVTLVYS